MPIPPPLQLRDRASMQLHRDNASPEPARILIAALLAASLMPAMAPQWGALRYMPAFLLLGLSAAYATAMLRHIAIRTHVLRFLSVHRMPLAAAVLYVLFLFIPPCIRGQADDVRAAAANALVLIVAHLFVPVAIRGRKDVMYLLAVMVCIGLLCAASAFTSLLLSAVTAHEIGTYPSALLHDKAHILGRLGIPYVARGLFSHPNFQGMLAAYTVAAALFLHEEASSKLTRRLVMAAVAAGVVTVLISASFIAVPALLAVLGLYRLARRRAVFVVIRLLVIVLIVVPDIIVMAGIRLDFLRALPVTSPSRIALWNAALGIIGDHWFLGIGPERAALSLPGRYAAHNTFLDTALRGGIPAMLLYSAYLLLCLFALTVKPDRPLAVYALLTILCVCILQLFETLLFGGMSVVNFFFLASMLACLSARAGEGAVSAARP